jgi:hypothetical protein
MISVQILAEVDRIPQRARVFGKSGRMQAGAFSEEMLHDLGAISCPSASLAGGTAEKQRNNS